MVNDKKNEKENNMTLKVDDKVTFVDKWGKTDEGVIFDTNYKCDFDERLNGCVRLIVTNSYGTPINTIIDKEQIIVTPEMAIN